MLSSLCQRYVVVKFRDNCVGIGLQRDIYIIA